MGCIDATRATDHHSSIIDQLGKKGEKAKITAASFMIPKILKNKLFDGLVSRSAPVSGIVADRPVGFGSEAVVYPYLKDSVLKVYYTPCEAAELLDEVLENQALQQSFLGEFVLATEYVIGENPYGEGDAVYGVQEKIEKIDLKTTLSVEQVISLTDGVLEMHESLGYVPDVNVTNLGLTSHGDLRLIDTGTPVDTIRTEANTVEVMSRLRSMQDNAA